LKDDILKIIPSNEPEIIQKYLEDYLVILRNNIDQYTTELMAQSSSCPVTLLPLKIIDQKLKEFVHLHHLDLLRAINYQIGKLNSKIYIKQFSEQLASFRLTMKQVLLKIIEILYIFVSLLYSCLE
jgi:hypothetical protein